MAVADKPATKATLRNPVQELALASLCGAAFLVASLSFILSGIPTFWNYWMVIPSFAGNETAWISINDLVNNDFLSTALVIIASVGASLGLYVVGKKIEGRHPPRGARAGSYLGAFFFFAIFIISFAWVGNSLVARDVEPMVYWIVILGIASVLLVGVYVLFNLAPFSKFLVSLEENGWFSTRAFKFNQGQKVRRATLIAFLVLVGTGIWGNLRSGLFGTGNWEVALPGVNLALVLLFNVQYMFPFLLFIGFGWFVWRAVNWPTFADFLIATEAEINKVSWTTRKRLIQDTVVVLVTVLLFTVFLFVVDIVWIRVLSFEPFPGVLQINPQQAKQKQLGPTDW